MHSRAKVLNYHYGFYSQWWRQWTEDLFCDEAHRLPVVLSDLVSIELRDSLRKRYSLPDFPLALGRLVPPFETMGIALHFAHRLTALVVLVSVLLLLRRCQRLEAQNREDERNGNQN